MNTPMKSFRLDAKTLRMMDRLVRDPPTMLLDKIRGSPRNRTELIEVLVKLAAEAQEKEKGANGEKP